MTSHFEGQREANYRERSNNPSMAGIGVCATFRCAVCKQPKEAFGRKLLIKGYSKGGYKCADCVAMSAANSAGKEKPASQAGKPQRVLNNLELF
jgi:hypothetical protein